MYIDIVKFKNGQRLPMLLDDNGMPVVAPNEWVLSRRQKALKTLARNLQELLPLYVWLDDKCIDLHALILSGRCWGEALVNSLVEQLRRVRPQTRKVVKLAVSPDTANKRIRTVINFLIWYFDVVISDGLVDEGRRALIRESKKEVVARLYSGWASPEPPRRGQRKYLLDAEARFLQEALEPSRKFKSCLNSAVRLRNYLVVCLMLLYGLRPGEVLCLRLKDIEFGAISNVRVCRRRTPAYDVRSRPPSVKRAGRVLPLDNPDLAFWLNRYAMNERERFARRGKGKGRDFFFLSNNGLPLSESSLQKIFTQARSAHADRLPVNLTAKALRHTFTYGLYRTMRSRGMSMSEIKQNLMYLRGDTAETSQDAYIDYREHSQNVRREYQLLVASGRNAEDVPF